ncbi:GAF and ANTAR domain-containing protein [Actinokineospora auranticolor]|uniref:GAF and ANTAR domain-containing protein n=1 Tax=Actinokineospora auranticolor TaxID=155976 RepID=UPI001FE32DD0|nr:GAF and ANTAR domain-containing protein [Actinokineospora auranticolor]
MVDAGDDAVRRIRETVLDRLRDGGTGLEALGRVCHACVELLPIDGASVSVMTGFTGRESLYATDEVAARIEAVQFSLGEGPCFQAFDTRRPVLAPDLRTVAWPVFAAEIAAEPVGALFGFPLVAGAISIGAMDMYRRAPGWMSAEEVGLALRLVDVVTLVLLGLRHGGVDGAWSDLPLSHVHVHQATGVLIAAFDLPPEQALARLRGYAFATGRLVDDVADDLVSQRIRPEDLGLP